MATSNTVRIAKRVLLVPVIVPFVIIWVVADHAFQKLLGYLRLRRDKWRELNEDQKYVCLLDASIRSYRYGIKECFERARASSTPEELQYHLDTAWRYVGNYGANMQGAAVVSGRCYEDRNDID